MSKKNRMMILLALVLLPLIYAIGFTPINLAIAKILFPARLETYRYLDEGAQSSNFAASYLYYDPANIDYDIKTGGFIITTAHVNQAFEVYHKLDANGRLIDSLVSDTSAKHTFYQGGVVFGEEYFIDWAVSGQKSKQIFSQFLNRDFKMTETQWEEFFKANYAQASFVTYQASKDWNYLTFYFKIANSWVAMNTFKNDERIYQDLGSINELDFKGYPVKGNRFIALKGMITQNYPLLSYLHQSNEKDYVYDWSDDKNPITLAYFKKEKLQGRAPYTNLPQTWGGDGYLDLKHKNQIIPFKEIGVKDVGIATQAEVNVELYTPPTPYNKKSDVAFIILSYGTNISDRGANGLYVIRRK